MLPNGKAELALPVAHQPKVPSEKLECFIICIGLLVMVVLSYALYCNMQDNWQFDPELRYNVFLVAFLMLLLSIVICYYIRYRLSSQVVGYHISQQYRLLPLYSNSQLSFSNNLLINCKQRCLISVNSHLQLITSELPPSYESIMKHEVAPPPYNFDADRLHTMSTG